MAFISSGGNVISFAEYENVLAMDQRLFEANEGLTEIIVEDALVRATDRILTKIRSSKWWRDYYISKTADFSNVITVTFPSVPAPDANKIKARQADFTDLACYYALAEILLPKIADFGNTDTAERQKIGFYDEKFRAMFNELLEAGDWYDFSGDNTIATDEKRPSRQNLVRVR
jgi:hypothetical protein